MKVMLKNKIKSNQLSADKPGEEKVQKERVERSRLMDLLNAEKQQLLDKIFEYTQIFKLANGDSLKKREREYELNRRKQLNIDSLNAVLSQWQR